MASPAHPSRSDGARPITGRGPGRLLIAVYAIFAVAATSRAAVQISSRFDEAPLAYALSAVAAGIYVLATIGLARGTRSSRRLALVCLSVELAGVLVVGALSLARPEAFPDATVWSGFGRGYLFIPLVLPVLGLAWLKATRPAHSGGTTVRTRPDATS